MVTFHWLLPLRLFAKLSLWKGSPCGVSHPLCPLPLQVKACNAEAVKLATFINNHTPMFASDPILSHLVAAEVATTTFLSSHGTTPPVNTPGRGEPASAGLIVPSVTVVTLLLILSLLF